MFIIIHCYSFVSRRGRAREEELIARDRVKDALRAADVELLEGALLAAEALGLQVEGRARLAQLVSIRDLHEAIAGDYVFFHSELERIFF